MTDTTKQIQSALIESAQLLKEFMIDNDCLNNIAAAAEIMAESISKGGKIIICGNGGSMCDAMHFAAELTGKLSQDRPPIPAIAISDPAHLSCVANDYGYQHVFGRYMALCNSNDILIVISTSGMSQNICIAAKEAGYRNIKVIGLTGNGGGTVGWDCDIEIRVPGTHRSGLIQEIHIKVIHILCALLEQKLYPHLKP
jgi:D-sedoheptulose 7-phosphate isomerase